MSTMHAMLQQLDQLQDTADQATPADDRGPDSGAAARPGRRKRGRRAGQAAGKAGRKKGSSPRALPSKDVTLTLPQGRTDLAGQVPAPAFAIRLPAHWVAPGTQLGIDPRPRRRWADGSSPDIIDVTPAPAADAAEWSKRWAVGCVQRSRLHKGRKIALALTLTAAIPLAWATNWLGLLPAPLPTQAQAPAEPQPLLAETAGDVPMSGFGTIPPDAGRPWVLGLDSMTGPLVFAHPSLGLFEPVAGAAVAPKRGKVEATTVAMKSAASAVRPAAPVTNVPVTNAPVEDERVTRAPVAHAPVAEAPGGDVAAQNAVPVMASPAALPETAPAQIERRPRGEADPLQKVGELMAVGRRGEAIQALQVLLQRDPGNAQAHRALLALLDERGRGEDWLRALQDSARALPLQFGLLAAKGLAEAGQVQPALDLLLTLPEPAQDLAYWSARGAMHQQAEQHEAAQAAFAQALAMVPPGAARASSLQLARAASLQALGRQAQAREAWQQVLALQSASAEAREHAMRQLQGLGTRAP